ncbi:MAG: CoA transferase [Chloroflexi bacterium]|nr:CoA transferase [Chloroflexota bacterium]
MRGIRVVDVSRMQAGPLATMMLGDLGADVIKVEQTGKGDLMRRIGIHYLGPENTYFLSVNRSKRSVAVDFRSPEGLALVRRLTRSADVFVENFRPGTVNEMGLDDATLRAENPRLVYCSVSAFGQTGPLSHQPGLDPVLQGFSGMMSMTGEPGRPPVRTGAATIDTMTAMLAAQAIAMALFERERSGLGQKVELSLLNSALWMLIPREGPYFATGQIPTREGYAHPQHVPHQVFETQDGWISVITNSDERWRRLCEALGHPEWGEDPRYATSKLRLQRRDEVIALISPTFKERPTAAWVEILERHDVLHGLVNDVAEALSHPQVLHNEMVVSQQHPTAGTVRTLGIPMRFDRTPGRPVSPPPLLGEHTDEVLRELGIGQAELADLHARGIVARAPSPQ